VHAGSYSACCADNSNVSGQKYDNNMNANMTLVTPIDISTYTNVTFSFWIWYRTYNSSDYLSFQYYNGSTWVEQQRWYGTSSAWLNPSYALTGFTTYQFRLIFYSNASTTREGAYVDDIALVGTPNAARVMGEPSITLVSQESDLERDEPIEATPPASADLAIAWTRTAQPRAQLSFALPQAAQTRFEIFDVDGRCVDVLANEMLAAGPHTFAWPGEGAHEASGVYYARLALDGGAATGRTIVLVK
jgi:hypothetical protein